jgi:hypothetical protein
MIEILGTVTSVSELDQERVRVTATGASDMGDRGSVQWWAWTTTAPSVGDLVSITVKVEATMKGLTVAQMRARENVLGRDRL